MINIFLFKYVLYSFNKYYCMVFRVRNPAAQHILSSHITCTTELSDEVPYNDAWCKTVDIDIQKYQILANNIVIIIKSIWKTGIYVVRLYNIEIGTDLVLKRQSLENKVVSVWTLKSLVTNSGLLAILFWKT